MRDEQLLAKSNRVNVLLDIYGSLLTEKQQLFLRLQFQEDYSLSEISEQFQVTRQAVNDHIKRACDSLEQYETKLQLFKNYHQRSLLIDELEDVCTNYMDDADFSAKCLNIIKKLKSLDEG